MRVPLQVTIYCIFSLCVYGQAPLQKVLIIRNSSTGRTDTVKAGSFIKLWYWSDRKIAMEQPLARTDFRKHTYYIESVLIDVTDSSLLFIKRPPFIPIPVPIKVKDAGFDTVMLSNITSLRVLNRNVTEAVKSAPMLPAMSFLPSFFTTFWGLVVMMPSMQFATTYWGDVVYPLHRVNHDKNLFSLSTASIPADTQYFIQQRKMKSVDDYEWEIERQERYDKMYNHIRRELSDQLLDTYMGNKVINVTLGMTYIPSAFQTGEDVKTRINITEKKFYFGIASENFISDRHRIGVEIQMNKTEKYMSLIGSNSSQLSASMGTILSNFSYFKYGLGGIYSNRYKQRQWAAIRSLDEDIARENDEIEQGYLRSRRTFLRDLLAAEPRPYLLLGIGAINSTLLKIKGSVGDIDAKDYSQKRFAMEGGVGMFTRAGRRLAYDLSVKYIWSPKYDPVIGGIDRYSGFRVQINVGYMTGPAFARYRRTLKMVNTNAGH